MKQIFSQAKCNLNREELLACALEKKEGYLADNGALVVETGHRTGRSPKDRYIVCDQLTQDAVDWTTVNQPFDVNKADLLWQRVEAFVKELPECYEQNLRVGANDHYGINVHAINTYAWHALFVKNLFIDQGFHSDLDQWTLMSVPQFVCEPERDGTQSDGCVVIDLGRKRVLIAGMRYAGEMKKSFFSVLNFLLPMQGVLPMHCAANQEASGENVSLFFGLSGTGKTTLSADPKRQLIGDDEHGWGDEGVFNFEGGCYAKCIDITEKNEPLIWHAIQKYAVLENVVTDDQGRVDYTDASKTSNTRAVYPRSFIPDCVQSNMGKTPSQLIFLCCDLYGVLPPIARLTADQAAYYFLSGYTALVGSTEVGGGNSVKPVFSPCFGAVFFPHPYQVYANLLKEKIRLSNAPVYLMNTGWHAGGYGSAAGKRYSIGFTRQVLDAVHNGTLARATWQTMPGFGFEIPVEVEGMQAKDFDPSAAWADAMAYEANKANLIEAFVSNFKQHGLEDLAAHGPSVVESQEACL